MRKKRKKIIGHCLLCLIILVSLCVSGSRTGMVAAFVGVAFIYWDIIVNLSKKRRAVFAVGAIMIGAILLGGCLYRYESVDARLLIWRVSLNMIADHVILGFGPGNFPYNYMFYQADYFMQHPDSKFIMVADNVVFPYNEYLKLAVEFGLVGLVLFVSILYLVWRHSKIHDGFAVLITLLVVGLFSYPSDKIILASILPLSLGAILHDNIAIRIPNWAKVIVLVIAVSITAITCFLFVGSRISKNKFIDAPSSETLCADGEVYMKQLEYDLAEECFVVASYMVPTRIQPNYLLWKLYVDSGRDSDAGEIAEKILSMQLKIENTYTLRVKDEIRAAQKMKMRELPDKLQTIQPM